MRELIIKKNDAGQRLDKFLTKALDLPVSLLYKSIRTKKIKVNRKRAENNTLLCEGRTGVRSFCGCGSASAGDALCL